MKFTIKKKEKLPAALRRIATEQLEIAMDHTKGTKKTATSVHCARKAIKRTRAVLKLVRCDSNRTVVDGDDRDLRDAAKLLAANRDLHVQQMALKRLSICKNNGSCSIVWKRLRVAQDDLRQHSEDDLKQFGAAVKAARAKVPTWNIHDVDSAFITKSLTHSYRRARKRSKACATSLPARNCTAGAEPRKLFGISCSLSTKSVQKNCTHFRAMRRSWPKSSATSTIYLCCSRHWWTRLIPIPAPSNANCAPYVGS